MHQNYVMFRVLGLLLRVLMFSTPWLTPSSRPAVNVVSPMSTVTLFVDDFKGTGTYFAWPRYYIDLFWFSVLHDVYRHTVCSKYLSVGLGETTMRHNEAYLRYSLTLTPNLHINLYSLASAYSLTWTWPTKRCVPELSLYFRYSALTQSSGQSYWSYRIDISVNFSESRKNCTICWSTNR